MNARQVKSFRKSLRLTQQEFATLLGLSFASVNRWENGATTATGLSLVLLQLLDEAIKAKGSKIVLQELKARSWGQPVTLVKTLARLAQVELPVEKGKKKGKPK